MISARARIAPSRGFSLSVDFLEIIAKRRDGTPHFQEELEFLAQGAANGSIPDFQLTAWLMAAVKNPLTPQETAWLTMAMARSGKILDLTGLPTPWLDKHSTGGVGDKTSIVLLPLLAACGITIVKMSGRGLGITGGTVDKLESVPGFRMDLSPEELLEKAKKIGCAITGQTAELAPADKTLYALRDATGTVASIPLIVSSILSKKVAGGTGNVVIDVKCGAGAFMPDFDAAEKLANALKETGHLCGLNIRLAITDMSQPLGRAVGNALEVAEALEVLNGNLYGRFPKLCLDLAGLALVATKRAQSLEDGSEMAHEAIRRGHAAEKAAQWFESQGADKRIVHSIKGLPTAPQVEEVLHKGQSGWVSRVDARTVGETALGLGGGRKHKGDDVDHAVGIEVLISVGEQITEGTPIFRIHAKNANDAKSAAQKLHSALKVSKDKTPGPPLILATM